MSAEVTPAEPESPTDFEYLSLLPLARGAGGSERPVRRTRHNTFLQVQAARVTSNSEKFWSDVIIIIFGGKLPADPASQAT